MTERPTRRWHVALLVCLTSGCLDWGALQDGRCGDGILQPTEMCDDGNIKDGDGCDEQCDAEPTTTKAVCGNGQIEAGETCDDNATADGDGCSSSCQVEPVKMSCGNGRIDAGETCDDNATADGDGCSTTCQVEPVKLSCGNGQLDPDEVCDDGNDSNADACLNGCSRATCGDGQLRRDVEECDRAAIDAVNCTATCLVCDRTQGGYFRVANAHCFTRHAQPRTAAEARATCQAEGGDLWTLTSKAEANDVISKLMLDGRYWLGLETRPSGNSWVNGEVVKYAAFDKGEPSAAGVGCVSSTVKSAIEVWQSTPCDTALRFVCERQAPFIALESNHAYKLHTSALPFEQALAACAAEGSALLSLETLDELEFVRGKVSLEAWVNATDREVEGRFVWSGGEEVDPATFSAGQPDDVNGSKNCLFLGLDDRLFDESCDRSLPFVCEHE